MHAHPEGMIFLQHQAKLGRNPLRQKNRDTRSDAQEFDVRDGTEATKNLLQFIIAEKQSVPAAEQNVPHLRVGFEILINLLKIGVQFLFAHTTDNATARAIAAITRTSIRHQK